LRALVVTLALAALAHAGCSLECATAQCAAYTVTLRVQDSLGTAVTAFHGVATSRDGSTYPWSCGEGEPVDPYVHCQGHMVTFEGDGFAEEIASVTVGEAGEFAGWVVDVDSYVAENRPETGQCDTSCWRPDIVVTLPAPTP
jgi:hypothetical protein